MSRAAIIAITRAKGPMTIKQLCDELRLARSTVQCAIARARAHGTQHLRIAAWAMDVPKYGPGPADDAEGGSTADKIKAHLQDVERATVAQIAAALGAPREAIDTAMRRLRAKKDRGGIRIAGWSRRREKGEKGGREAAIYALGREPDAPRPDFSQAQREAEKRYNVKRRVLRAMAGRAARPASQEKRAVNPFAQLMR